MTRVVAVLSVVAFLASAVYSEDEPKKWGPFDIQVDELTKCEEAGNGDLSVENLKVKAVAKTSFEISLDGTTKIPFDDAITVTAQISSYNPESKEFNGKSMTIPVGPVCTAFQQYSPKGYKKFFQAIGVEGCPVPPGTYSIKKYQLDLTLPFTQLPYNKFRTDISFMKDEKLLYCVRVFASIEPEGTVKY